MRRWGLLVIALALGCGGGDKAKLQAMKDAMCACKDAACAKKVDAEYKPWLRSFVEKFPKGEHGYQIPDDLKAIGDESDKCMREARKAEDKAEYENTVLHREEHGDSPAYAKLLALLTTAKDRMCACKDKACAAKVDADYESAAKASLGESHDIPSAEQQKQLEATGAAVEACRKQASN